MDVRHVRSSRNEDKIRGDFEDKGEFGPEPFSILKRSVSSFILEREIVLLLSALFCLVG